MPRCGASLRNAIDVARSNCVFLGKFLAYNQGRLNLLGEIGCHLRQQNLGGGGSQES